MIISLLIAGLLYTSFVMIEDTQTMEYDWVESCYGIECIGYTPEPTYQDDLISYWGYHTNI